MDAASTRACLRIGWMVTAPPPSASWDAYKKRGSRTARDSLAAPRAGARQLTGVSPLFLAELVPALLVHFDAELVGRLLDPLPSLVALVVADSLHLVEPGHRVADVVGIAQRFLAL